MANPPPPQKPPTVPVVYHGLPALLSYLVPGLGQIYQGRVAKGVLFMVCVYGLFFYGMALGHWRNVYLPDTAANNNPLGLWPTGANLYNRPQYLAQFWVGVVAWPAVYQYAAYDQTFTPPEEDEILRGPPDPDRPGEQRSWLGRAWSFVASFERTPDERVLNKLQTEGDKTWDLGWVYTVIAGVLNVMVIYDALAGPAFVPLAGQPAAGPPKETGAKHAAARA